jgi:hypothetical protein
MSPDHSILFQSAKLGDIPEIIKELKWAKSLLADQRPVGRVYGISGGSLPALAYVLSVSARIDPVHWGSCAPALDVFADFLTNARSRDLRALSPQPQYGLYHLGPLRQRVSKWLAEWTGQGDFALSDLPIPLYLCAMDHDAIFTSFGPLDDSLRFDYQFVQVGPPQDAPLLDALTAALSTMLSTTPVLVNGRWYRDCRPAIVDGGALVADLEARDPRPILRRRPHAPLRDWKLNTITSSSIMHSQHERNQPLTVAVYLDLLERQRELAERLLQSQQPIEVPAGPRLCHIQLPYVGSTEALTNMRQSVENKEELLKTFDSLLKGQLDDFSFHQPANVIYGAGGFSGILAGLVTTRAVDAGFEGSAGEIRQVYGVSAGVLNGFFHAVQLAAVRHPELYRPPAQRALQDLEDFIGGISLEKFARINRSPRGLWQGVANLGPLEAYLLERLAAYTGSTAPEKLTFDEVQLPLTIAAARDDGFTDFLGMSNPVREMHFAGREFRVQNSPIAKSILAGWSMNTYIQPTQLKGQRYRDGGGTFYDIGLFAACLDPELPNLVNIHLDEPEGHSYNLPPRPNLLRILFDTHNFSFPEQRRRMFLLSNLLYDHYRLRAAADKQGLELPLDFRQHWVLPEERYGEQS